MAVGKCAVVPDLEGERSSVGRPCPHRRPCRQRLRSDPSGLAMTIVDRIVLLSIAFRCSSRSAVVRAGLVDALNRQGAYTVFAPTDAAFFVTLGVSNEAAAIAAVNAAFDRLTAVERGSCCITSPTDVERASSMPPRLLTDAQGQPLPSRPAHPLPDSRRRCIARTGYSTSLTRCACRRETGSRESPSMVDEAIVSRRARS